VKKPHSKDEPETIGRYNRARRDETYSGIFLVFQYKIDVGIRRLAKEWAKKNHFKLDRECEHIMIIKNETVTDIITVSYRDGYWVEGGYFDLVKICDKHAQWIIFSNGMTAFNFMEWKNINQSTMEILIGETFDELDFKKEIFEPEGFQIDSNWKFRKKYSYCPNSGIDFG
jgi:hypothetical protein